MKVKVTGPYQVAHEGKVYTEGDTLEVPEPQARQWISAEYVEEVSSKKTSKHKKAPEPESSSE